MSAIHFLGPPGDFQIMMFGPPRVGKSTLINALVGKKVAATSGRISACTGEVGHYAVEVRSADALDRKVVTFWDTPGFEDWDYATFSRVVGERLAAPAHLVCAFICFAPGSFARVERIGGFCERLVSSGIYVALVQTNMYSGSLDQQEASFAEMLGVARGTLGDSVEECDSCHRFAGGMCARVNAAPFSHRLPNWEVETLPPENMELLIRGVCLGLKDESLIGWFLAILQNRSFFEKARIFLADNASSFAKAFSAFARLGGSLISDFLSSIGR